MKKVISFSLWGDNVKYLQGALENIRIAKELFPSWTCRFYVHSEVPTRIINFLQKERVEYILKDENPFIAPMNAPGMFWRFEVLKDPDIERCMVRDTDGRLSKREVNCVRDWEMSEIGRASCRERV